MRHGAIAVAVMATVSLSCKSGSSGTTLPAEDYSASFAAWWFGAETWTQSTSVSSDEHAALQITREGANRLRLEELCPDLTAVPALVTAASTLTVPGFTCAAVAMPGCAAVTVSWTGGSGGIDHGLLSLDVRGTAAGCGQSFPLRLQFDGLRGDAPPPQIAALSPVSAGVGERVALVVTGSGFAPKAAVSVGGTAVATTFVSETELDAAVPATALGTAAVLQVVVTNVDSQASLPVDFEVRNPVPAIASVAPASLVAGTPGATVTVNGSGFVATSQAACDGSPRPTTYVAPARISVALLPEDLAAGGDRILTVTNPAPGGGASGPVAVHVLNPAPVVAGVFPASLAAGGGRAFLTIAGSQLVSTASVLWNGAPRRTLFVSPTMLSVEIAASDVASPGTADVAVVNPPPGGGTAAAGTVAIVAPAAPFRAVAYQLDAAHDGRASSGGTLAFPTASAWSVALPDLLSYPLVADGKAFVLARASATGWYGTRLYALDLATGSVAWGPVAIPGTYFWAGHAYDAGKIFVLDYDGRLRAFDAATGTAGWDVQLPGQYAFSATPTAADGVVYAGGAGSGGTVYAVRESDGTVLWTAGVWNGDQSSPAVAPDAVYVSYPCQVYKLDRVTGAPIWWHQGGCEGGGGKTAAYAGGAVYVRDWGFSGEPYGTVYDAFDATVSGSFGTATYFPIPAVADGARYVLSGGSLQRWERDATQATWSFAGDGTLASAPIVVDDAVFVGSSSGTVYAVDAATGLERWSGSAGAAILGPDEQNVSQPLTGFGAGEGYLVVPAGSRLTAWRIVAP